MRNFNTATTRKKLHGNNAVSESVSLTPKHYTRLSAARASVSRDRPSLAGQRRGRFSRRVQPLHKHTHTPRENPAEFPTSAFLTRARYIPSACLTFSGPVDARVFRARARSNRDARVFVSERDLRQTQRWKKDTSAGINVS